MGLRFAVLFNGNEHDEVRVLLGQCKHEIFCGSGSKRKLRCNPPESGMRDRFVNQITLSVGGLCALNSIELLLDFGYLGPKLLYDPNWIGVLGFIDNIEPLAANRFEVGLCGRP